MRVLLLFFRAEHLLRLSSKLFTILYELFLTLLFTLFIVNIVGSKGKNEV